MTDIQDRSSAPTSAPTADAAPTDTAPSDTAAIEALELDLELDLDLDLLAEELLLEPAAPAAPVIPATSPHVRGAARRAARTSRSIRRRTVVMRAATVLLTALVAVTLLFQASGGRWFVVQTPSMGTTAPVGTLLLTTPVLLEDVQPGDVVSFHPSTTPDETYTHRVIAVDADGLTTQGDINGAVDPWKTDQAHLVGEATTILPGFGSLAKGVPLMLAGLVIVMILTRLIGSPTHRASMRMLGGALVAAFTVFLLKPFVGLVVLDAATRGSDVEATVVSTGILPIRIAAEGGTATTLAAGQVGTITAPAGDAGRFHDVSSTLDLPLWGWVVFFGLCAIPLIWTLVVGLPAEREERRA
ncbi:S26 family signal peptidase [Clavibacter sepedonicus]|uniref:Integral membrane protein n=1 Tax=Clavibacter sepedonicus TaxID=31964 RepID=B0RBH2_CLASE|nr:S26 family signal peptidase [Clavibacter sepedonicus]OQJ48394.1 S26 family signal peptidase [Clavibacter sepedonicus]OQJ53876.1 S26 family signal peptidase [Clavibacter sepedonicus]UUK65390.1 S26 family signal peptidase [Clavibacter sepedonicus]CAQ02868.1 putative integral membrane protein [Clavibacter sepedonicus]